MKKIARLPKEVEWKYDEYGNKIYNSLYYKEVL